MSKLAAAWARVTNALNDSNDLAPSSRNIGNPIDRIPPRASEKMRQLLQTAEDAKILTWAALDTIDELNARRMPVAARRLQMTTPAGIGGFGLREDHPSVIAQTKQIEAIDGEISRARHLVNARSAIKDATSGLAASIDRYLKERCLDREIKEHGGPTPKLSRGESAAAAVDRCRAQLDELRAELSSVRAAPIPSAEAKRIAREQFEALAKAGEPNVDRVLAFGESVGFPKAQQRQLDAFGAPGERIAVFDSSAVDALALLAWSMKETLLSRIEKQIDERADDARALTDDERAAKVAAIRAEILRIQRDEEAFIVQANESGGAILRRREADPRAVLGLADDMPAPERMDG